MPGSSEEGNSRGSSGVVAFQPHYVQKFINGLRIKMGQ